MARHHSFDYFIESIQNAISINQLNDISTEFDHVFLNGKLNLNDEQWDTFTTLLNTKINIIKPQSSHTTMCNY